MPPRDLNLGDLAIGEQLRGIQTVRVNKQVLIDRLKENRDRHRLVFEEALAGWQQRVVTELERMLDNARNQRKFTPAFSLPQPQDHTPDYKRIIALLEMSLDDELELDQREFAQYALDDWGWQGDFLKMSENYGSRTASILNSGR